MSGSWTDGNDGNKVANAGEMISCTYQVVNAGTQTLGDLCLDDVNVATEGGCFDCGLADGATISPGGSYTCSTTYEVLLMFSGLCS